MYDEFCVLKIIQRCRHYSLVSIYLDRMINFGMKYHMYDNSILQQLDEWTNKIKTSVNFGSKLSYLSNHNYKRKLIINSEWRLRFVITTCHWTLIYRQSSDVSLKLEICVLFCEILIFLYWWFFFNRVFKNDKPWTRKEVKPAPLRTYWTTSESIFLKLENKKQPAP